MRSPPRGRASAASARRGSSCGWPLSEGAAPPTTMPSGVRWRRTCAAARGGGPSSTPRAGSMRPTTSIPARRHPPPPVAIWWRRRPGRHSRGAIPRPSERVWRAGGAASRRTPPPPTRSWRCPTAAAVGPWRPRSPRHGRWRSGFPAATPPLPCAIPWRSPPVHGSSPCEPPSWSPPTSSPTRRGACPAASR